MGRSFLHHNPAIASAVLRIFLRAIRTTLREASSTRPRISPHPTGANSSTPCVTACSVTSTATAYSNRICRTQWSMPLIGLGVAVSLLVLSGVWTRVQSAPYANSRNMTLITIPVEGEEADSGEKAGSGESAV